MPPPPPSQLVELLPRGISNPARRAWPGQSRFSGNFLLDASPRGCHDRDAGSWQPRALPSTGAHPRPSPTRQLAGELLGGYLTLASPYLTCPHISPAPPSHLSPTPPHPPLPHAPPPTPRHRGRSERCAGITLQQSPREQGCQEPNACLTGDSERRVRGRKISLGPPGPCRLQTGNRPREKEISVKKGAGLLSTRSASP